MRGPAGRRGARAPPAPAAGRAHARGRDRDGGPGAGRRAAARLGARAGCRARRWPRPARGRRSCSPAWAACSASWTGPCATSTHPGAHRDFQWDLSRASWIRGALGQRGRPERRALVERVLDRYEAEVVPALPRLRRGVVHGDANDHNVLVGAPRAHPREVSGPPRLRRHAPRAARGGAGGRGRLRAPRARRTRSPRRPRSSRATTPPSRSRRRRSRHLFALVGARLAVSVTSSAVRAKRAPGDPYVTVSEAPAWEALERLDRVHPRFAHYAFRDGLRPAAVPARPGRRLVARAGGGGAGARRGPARRAVPRPRPGRGQPLPRRRPAARRDRAADRAHLRRDEAGGRRGRRWGATTRRAGSTSRAAFAPGGRATDERRTVHLGIDLFVEPGTTRSRAAARASSTSSRTTPPRRTTGRSSSSATRPGDAAPFFTLYGHLTEDTLPGLAVGQRVEAGQAIARVGAPPANGDWPPHLHFQVILDLLGRDADFPGRRPPEPAVDLDEPLARPERPPRASPRSASLPRSPPPRRRWPRAAASSAATSPCPTGGRSRSCAASAQYLYDESGRAYLDAYNNVPLVGHSHPRVVRAAQEQLALLNTNTRYLHDTILRYAERLTRLLPEPLRVCYFVTSGSEANELALRLARARTGREDVIVLEHALPRAHHDPRGREPLQVRRAGRPGAEGVGARRAAAGHVPRAATGGTTRRRGRSTRGTWARSPTGCRPRGAGSPRSSPRRCRASPGRSSSRRATSRRPTATCARRAACASPTRCRRASAGWGDFWGFEGQGVVPDVVVLGKPIGNGFPLGAVVTTREIADAFDNGMEFFSTFGGNPVSCAAGLAVLDVVEEERLQERARRVGRPPARGAAAALGAARRWSGTCAARASSSGSSSCATARASSRPRRRRRTW